MIAALLVVGAGCSADGDGKASADTGAAITEGAAVRSREGGQQQVIPSPLAAGPDGGQTPTVTGRRPPLPNLTNRPREMPPNTLSLEDLHRQGQTHVLR